MDRLAENSDQRGNDDTVIFLMDMSHQKINFKINFFKCKQIVVFYLLFHILYVNHVYEMKDCLVPSLYNQCNYGKNFAGN